MDAPARPVSGGASRIDGGAGRTGSPVWRYRFDPHRVLALDSRLVALLSKSHRGWAVLDRLDYEILAALSGAPEGGGEIAAPAPLPVLERLHRVGLVRRNGSIPATCEMRKSKKTSTLLIKMTGACNYACTYCYDFTPERAKAHVSVQRVSDIIDTLLGDARSLHVTFHGGEPLLRFKDIKRIVAHCREVHGPDAVHFTMQSNGSLLKAEVVDFLSEHDFSVGISLDGTQVETDSLRPAKDRRETATETFVRLLADHPDFIRDRCGVLSVLSAANIGTFTDFALWLQDKGVNGLSFTVLDPVGRAEADPANVVRTDDVTALYAKLIAMVDTGEIDALRFSNLTVYMDVLASFNSHHICYKGPCGAGAEFLVMDSNGDLRSCDCVLDDFFRVPDGADGSLSERVKTAQARITERHARLAGEGPCRECPWINLCGGTCVAKAIGLHGTSDTPYATECAVSRYIYPELLTRFARTPDSRLFSYHRRHSSFPFTDHEQRPPLL